MKNLSNIIFIIIFVIILVFVPIFMIITKDKEFSENENRYLAEIPKINIDNILSGKFSKEFEKYVDDQFAFREKLYELKTQIQILAGNKDINNVYLAKDNYLIEKKLENEFNTNKLIENIDKLNNFFEKNQDKNIQVMIAPTAELILKDKLPENYSMYDQNKAIDLVKENIEYAKFIDVRNTLLAHKNEYIYYKTDHHWTSLGSFYAYEEWCKQNNLNTNILDFNRECVTTDFKGTLYSKVLNKNVEKDSIEIFKNDLKYVVKYNFGRKVNNSIYDLEKLNQKDKYQVFFGGNYPELNIKIDNDKNNKLLIIKDSFANSFIPFLMNYYKEIYVVDLRYFKEDLNTYLNESEISDILVLYNINNFAE